MKKNIHSFGNEQRKDISFSIVAIGAANGGLEAALEIFTYLPTDTGLTYVYVQHNAPPAGYNPVPLLSEKAKIPVKEARNGYPVQTNHLYILPVDRQVTITDNQFIITPLLQHAIDRMPVDRLFTALAAAYSNKIIGIVLSGITDDGTTGLHAIKAAGGLTFVQDDSAHYKVMPRAAIAAGVVDKILSPLEMAYELGAIGVLLTTRKKAVAKPTPPPKRSAAPDKNIHAQQLETALQRNTQDLQQFAYVANHHLKESLRKISIFSDRLQRVDQHTLSESGKNYVTNIHAAAQHLFRLLEDLAAYINIASVNDPCKPTDLQECLAKALHGLQSDMQQKQAQISYRDLPVIQAVPAEMALLFSHLLTNAVKFAHPERDPVITIMGKKLAAEQVRMMAGLYTDQLYYEIRITDNGIGFNPQFSTKIFSIFERLHDKHAYPGSGIGLAICQKIVHKHQGHIYAQSTEGTGSTFYLILPVKQLSPTPMN